MAAPDLKFSIEGAEPVRFGASPQLNFKLRVSSDSGTAIHSVLLNSQIHLDTSRRHYGREEQQRLSDLFGEPARWGETLRPLLWTNTSAIIPSFKQNILADLPEIGRASCRERV